MSNVTEIMFLGTAGYIPNADNDTSSILINRNFLIDTGWSLVRNLQIRGINPLDINYLFFTHMHHDHYLSLPSLIFYCLCKGKPLNELTIIGPASDLERVVRLACDFLQFDWFYKEAGYPRIIALNPGDSCSIEEMEVTTCPTLHPVQGICYRFTDRNTGKIIAVTGDTAYYPPVVDHVKNSDLLVHEVSMGVSASPESKKKSLHSDAEDAGKVAMEANVGKLFLNHGNKARAGESIAIASQYFKNEILWPENGVSYTV